jgi:hypothetical protein
MASFPLCRTGVAISAEPESGRSPDSVAPQEAREKGGAHVAGQYIAMHLRRKGR